jgi:hypothetical protein
LAHAALGADSRAMSRGCEICQSLAASTGALVTSKKREVFRVLMSDRLLVLCAEHAAEVENTRVNTLDELRGYFLEPFPGQRSLIPRRSAFDTPEALPGCRSPGRRASDRVSADER